MLRSRLRETGELPPGIAQDLAQIANLLPQRPEPIGTITSGSAKVQSE